MTTVYVILSIFGCYVANNIKFFYEDAESGEGTYFGSKIKLSKTIKQVNCIFKKWYVIKLDDLRFGGATHSLW